MTLETLSTSPNSVRDIAKSLFPQKNDDTIRSLDEFVEEIPAALRQRKRDGIDPGAPDDPVSILFRRAHFPEDQWKEYAKFDKKHPYTRNLIATDHENYTLLLLCWNPGKESPIHDHPCDGCWLKVFRGNVRECRYDSDLNCISDETFHEGQLGYIYDSMGYHKVGNPTSDTPAVTLHLYAPPIARCRIWRNEDPDCEEVVKSTNFSEFGKIIAT